MATLTSFWSSGSSICAGPTAGSVEVGLTLFLSCWARSTRERTSLHQTTRRAGSADGCWTADCWTDRIATVGRGAVREGGPSRAAEGTESGDVWRGPRPMLAKELESEFWWWWWGGPGGAGAGLANGTGKERDMAAWGGPCGGGGDHGDQSEPRGGGSGLAPRDGGGAKPSDVLSGGVKGALKVGWGKDAEKDGCGGGRTDGGMDACSSRDFEICGGTSGKDGWEARREETHVVGKIWLQLLRPGRDEGIVEVRGGRAVVWPEVGRERGQRRGAVGAAGGLVVVVERPGRHGRGGHGFERGGAGQIRRRSGRGRRGGDGRISAQGVCRDGAERRRRRARHCLAMQRAIACDHPADARCG